MTEPRKMMYCPECDTEREFRAEEREEEFEVRGERIVLRLPLHTCAACGEWIVDESYGRDPTEQIYEEYRKRKGWLTPAQIVEARKQYGLSQRDFAMLLGMSQATINRYEGGALQDEAHDVSIRTNAKPENMRDLLERKGHELKKAPLKRALKAVESNVGSLNQKVEALCKRMAATAGIGRRYFKERILPSNWEDEYEDSSAGFERLCKRISGWLGVLYEQLIDTVTSIKRPDVACNFKVRANVATSELEASSWIALRAAALACSGIPVGHTDLPTTAAAIRQEILADDSVACVNLENLLDFCWFHAIPILHVPKLPGKKMDGLAGYVEGRPVVVLCKNQKHSAWLLFDLAHELGHIVSGHVKAGGVLVDEKVNHPGKDEEQQQAGKDEEEQQANSFAVELLTGNPKTVYKPSGGGLRAPQLADEARKKEKVDPGVVVMNYAWGRQLFAVGNAALNMIEPDMDAPALIRKKMLDYIEWDLIEDDTAEFLRRLTRRD